jgi:hypothetical protein
MLLVLFHSSKGSLVDIKMLRFRQATVDRPYRLCRITASTQPRNTDQIWENCRMKEKLEAFYSSYFMATKVALRSQIRYSETCKIMFVVRILTFCLPCHFLQCQY